MLDKLVEKHYEKVDYLKKMDDGTSGGLNPVAALFKRKTGIDFIIRTVKVGNKYYRIVEPEYALLREATPIEFTDEEQFYKYVHTVSEAYAQFNPHVPSAKVPLVIYHWQID